MEQFEYMLIKMFIEENWTNFLEKCEEHGLSEPEADDLMSKLEKLSQE